MIFPAFFHGLRRFLDRCILFVQFFQVIPDMSLHADGAVGDKRYCPAPGKTAAFFSQQLLEGPEGPSPGRTTGGQGIHISAFRKIVVADKICHIGRYISVVHREHQADGRPFQ